MTKEVRRPRAEIRRKSEIRNPSPDIRKERWWWGLFLFLLLCVFPDMPCRAATFVVTNTADSGAGSLRQAIISANATPGANLIQFNLPGSGVRTIAPFTQFPDITNSVTIDGYSQPGSITNTLASANNAVLAVRLDGASVTNNAFSVGLRLNG